jgi:hypothetical protein
LVLKLGSDERGCGSNNKRGYLIDFLYIEGTLSNVAAAVLGAGEGERWREVEGEEKSGGAEEAEGEKEDQLSDLYHKPHIIVWDLIL